MNIVQGFKHLFIPHEHNDYHPHFFRAFSVGVIVFVCIFLLGASAGSSFFVHKTVEGATIAAEVLVDLTNKDRLALNEAPLTINPVLEQAAALKGQNMADEGYFAHNSPKGVTPWYWFKQVGYNFLYAGENLAINFTEAEDVNQAWLGSPTHKANLINANFREIGIAAIPGVYNNYPTIFVVQMFGTPAAAKEAASKTLVVHEPVESALKEIKPPLVISNTKGTVEGSSTQVTSQTKTTEEIASTSPQLQSIVDTKELVIVKNNDAVSSDIAAFAPVEKYSNWKDKLLVFGSKYIDIFYKVLLVIITIALIALAVIEYEKQHYKHLLYGVTMLVLLTLFMIINKLFI
jgi:hypothetical protein